jgi:hypothetical protein
MRLFLKGPRACRGLAFSPNPHGNNASGTLLRVAERKEHDIDDRLRRAPVRRVLDLGPAGGGTQYTGQRRYRWSLLFFGTISLMLIGSVFAFNLKFDPYVIFAGADGISGPTNSERSRLSAYSYIPKAAQIIRERPDAILLGTSVVDSGFITLGSMVNYYAPDPDSFQRMRQLLGAYYPIYNAAIRGKSMEEAWEFLQHSYVNNPRLRRVFLGVDWTMFMSGAAPVPLAATISAIGRTYLTPDYLLQYSLSWSATKESLAMWEVANPEAAAWIAEARNRLLSVFSGAHAETDGLPHRTEQAPAMRTDSQYEVHNFVFTAWFVGGLSQASPVIKNHSSFVMLQKIVDFCRDKNIVLKVFITTKHPFFWTMADHFGMMEDAEYWLRQTAAIAPVWDFSSLVDFGPNADYFHPLDPLHFAHTGGELILPELLHDNPSTPGVTIVTPENVEAVIAGYRGGLRGWRNSHPELADAADAASRRLMQSLDLGRLPNHLPLMPVVYQPEYRQHRIIAILDTFVAIPDDHLRLPSLDDLLEPWRHGWPQAPTLNELLRTLDART